MKTKEYKLHGLTNRQQTRFIRWFYERQTWISEPQEKDVSAPYSQPWYWATEDISASTLSELVDKYIEQYTPSESELTEWAEETSKDDEE